MASKGGRRRNLTQHTRRSKNTHLICSATWNYSKPQKFNMKVSWVSALYFARTSLAGYCEDKYPIPCKMIADLGFCTQLEELATTCRESCGTCSQISDVALNMGWSADDGSIDLGYAQPEPETENRLINCGSCLDSHPDFCQGFQRQLKTECRKGHVQEKCQRSCGVCEPERICPTFKG